MFKFNKSIKVKIRNVLFVFFIVVRILTISSAGENIYEYYFIPDDTNSDSEIISEYNNFIEALPEEIRSQFPADLFENENDIVNKSEEILDFRYVWDKIVSNIVLFIAPSLKNLFLITGIIVMASLFRQLKNDGVNGETKRITDSVISIIMVISIVNTDILSLDAVENFKNLICNIMNGMVPVFGIVYAASGNGSTSAIQSGGILMLVTICQNLFSMILMPSIRICLLMGIANTVFPDSGISSVSNLFRNISIGIISVCVTLFSFVLGLQNTVAQTADSFGIRSIKFIVGNLVPIIGGPVSDSLGTVGGSLSLLKNAGGTITIIIILTLLMPVISKLLINRFMLFIAKCVAEMLGASTEEKLIDDMSSVLSMMLSFSISISISFIYVLTLFTGSTLAVMS